MGGYGWMWMDNGGYGTIFVDMAGYVRIWVDIVGYGCIWENSGARGFAKLRRCSPDLRAQVHPPKKTSCRKLEPCNLLDLNLQDL